MVFITLIYNIILNIFLDEITKEKYLEITKNLIKKR